MKVLLLLSLATAGMLVLAGCTQPSTAPEPGVLQSPTPTTASVTTPGAGLANPAAVYCKEKKKFGYEIRKNPDGSEYGVCILPDGTECDEWEFYLGSCPATGTSGIIVSNETMPNPSAAFCLSKNYTYETRGKPDGSEYGACIFPDGKECEAWAFFLNECNETMAR